METPALILVTLFVCWLIGNALAKKFPAKQEKKEIDYSKEWEQLDEEEREKAIEEYIKFTQITKEK